MSVPRVPYFKSGQSDFYKWRFHLKIPLMSAEQRSHSSGRHCRRSSPLPAVFPPPHSSSSDITKTSTGSPTMEMIFSLPLTMISPVFCSGRRLSSQATEAQVLFFFLSHHCQTGGPALWRNESPGCFKAQPVSGLEGLAIHSLHIVLQATMGCMGARPFVIGSVVNSCWGNKSVTHLWLWIRSSLFFLLLSSDIAHGSADHIKSLHWDRNRLSWSTPWTIASRDFLGIIILLHPRSQFLSVRCLWTQLLTLLRP